MKNFEKYKDYISKHGTNPMAIRNGEATFCVGIKCSECLFKPIGGCSERKSHWLYEEYKKPKIKISRATKVILENLDEKWKWIAKDKDGTVFAYNDKPEKGNESWLNTTGCTRCCFKKEVFNFLSWEDEEPTNIKELLENCEVIE